MASVWVWRERMRRVVCRGTCSLGEIRVWQIRGAGVMSPEEEVVELGMEDICTQVRTPRIACPRHDRDMFLLLPII